MACSDYLSQQYEGQTLVKSFIAHNEDNQFMNRNNTYLVHANVSGEISFFSYGYSGEILTQSSAWNEFAIFTSNYVGPTNANKDGFCRNLIGRRMAIQRSIDEMLAVSAMNHISGHNYQCGEFLTGKSVNSEVASEGLHAFSNVSVDLEWLFHANMYLYLNVSQYPSDSSIARQNEANKMGKPQSLEDAMDFLGDESNASYPIYKSGQFDDYTLHTTTADLMSGSVNIYANNPRYKDKIYACKISIGCE